MSLINDMLHDLARRDRSHTRPHHEARAFDPLPRAHPLPSASGLDSRHWWRPLLWLNLVLVAALLALGRAWWVQSLAGGPFVQPTPETVRTAPPPAVAVAVTADVAEEPHAPLSIATTAPPAADAPGRAALPEPLPAPSVDSITLSGIATAPTMQRPPVVTRRETGMSDPEPTAITRPAPVAAKATKTITTTTALTQAPTAAPPPVRVAPPASPRTTAPVPAPAPAPVAAAATTVGRVATVTAQTLSARATPAPASAAVEASPPPSGPRPPPQASQPADSSPEWAEARLQQAGAERKQGATDAAMQTFKTLLDRQPQHVAARLELASLLQQRKQTPAAAELLSEGLMLLPRQTRFTLALAPLWIQAGQQADAMALLEQGARHASPKDGPYHAYYASQLLRLKRPVQAQQHFELAVASDPGRGEWLLGLGLALQANGRTQEAIAALQRASASGQLAPQNKAMVEQAIARLQSGS